MKIDFHTHAFPENIASRAIDTLKTKINRVPETDGTLDDLSSKMKLWGIDYSVVCNIATNPKQTPKVNSFAIDSLKKYPHIISLGSIHPEYDDAEGEIKRIKDAGIPGIKIHPDYMNHDIDDGSFDEIFEICSSLGLFVITHAGLDVCSPDHIHATPDMILRVIENHPKLKLICAHFGANCMWDEVLEKLCGKDIWIDTSLAYVEPHDSSQLRDIILNHDPDRILYGSDCPWCPPYDNVKFIEGFDLTDEFYEKIFETNARNLLGI